MPGSPPKYFECRKGNDIDSITKLVKKILNNLTEISHHSFSILRAEYNNMPEQLDAAVEHETEYNKRADTFGQKDIPLHALQRDLA